MRRALSNPQPFRPCSRAPTRVCSLEGTGPPYFAGLSRIHYGAGLAFFLRRTHDMGMSIRVRSLAGAIGALLLVGCGPVGESLAPEVRDPSVTLPGVQASPSLLRACERAAGRWEAATGILITCTEGDRPMYDDPINDWPQAGGATNRNEVRIDVADMQRLGALDLAVTHELGHVLFGGGHPVGGSLMAARPTDPQAPISEADLVWACERRTCTRFEAE